MGEFYGVQDSIYLPRRIHHERSYPVGDELVDEVGIKLDARGVYGIVAAAERDDARPGDGEPVSLRTIVA